MKKSIIMHNFIALISAILSTTIIVVDMVKIFKVYFIVHSRLIALKAINPLSLVLFIILMIISFYFMNLVDKETTRYHKMLKKKKLQQKRQAS